MHVHVHVHVHVCLPCNCTIMRSYSLFCCLTCQVIYHFIAGYTSKMAGTEEGITKPVSTKLASG